ncbi:unnamed protein product [Lampetra planeri]
MGPRRCGGPVTPPVVVFALCCAAAGAACLCVGEFVRRVAVRDPDVAQDWNSLLLHLGELDLCVQEQRSDNDTREVTPSPPAPARPARAPPTAPGPGADGPSSSAPPLPPRLLVSVRVLVTLTPSAGSAWGPVGRRLSSGRLAAVTSAPPRRSESARQRHLVPGDHVGL